MQDNHTFGRFIAARRAELGLKQAELAQRLKVSDKTISKWECGKGYPDIQLLQPLAAALGISLVELFECRRVEDPARTLPLQQADKLLANAIQTSQTQLTAVYRVIRGVLLALSALGFAVMLVCLVLVFMPVVLEKSLVLGIDVALIQVYGSTTMLYILYPSGFIGMVSLIVYLWVQDFTNPRPQQRAPAASKRQS